MNAPETINAGSAWAFNLPDGPLPYGIYRFVKQDSIYDIVWFYRVVENPGAQDRRVSGKCRRPSFGLYTMSLDRFEHAIRRGEVVEVSVLEPVSRLKAPSQLAGRRLAIFERRLPLLQAMADPVLLGKLLSDESRPGCIDLLCREYQREPREIRTLFERLLAFGLEPARAAVTGHDQCGKKANRDYKVKQGRPRRVVKTDHAPEWSGVNMDAVQRRNIRIFLQSGYNASNTSEQNFQSFKARFAVKQIQFLEGGRVAREMAPDNQFINTRQFRYAIQVARRELAENLKLERLKEITPRSARVSIGHAREGVFAPGQRLIIDSTVADVYLVCSWDRTRIIGRPFIYVVIDAATSLIVGFHITLQPPSAQQAKAALFTAMTSKQAILSSFDLGAYAELMPIAPRPSELMFDRAELLSLAGREMGKTMSCRLIIPPAYQPEWKGIVERHFGILNDLVIHWLPGSTKGRRRERGEKDVRLDAVLNLAEFTKLIVMGFLLWNLRGRPSIKATPEYLAADLPPAPVDIYGWGLEHLHGSPRYIDYDEAVVEFLYGSPVHIGERAVISDKQRWTAPWMTDEVLAAQGLLNKTVSLFRHPTLPTQGYLSITSEQALREVSLSSQWPVGEDWCIDDLHEYDALESLRSDTHQYKTTGFETAVTASSVAVVDEAKRLTKKALQERPASKAKRVKSIKKNRMQEHAPRNGDTATTRPPGQPAASLTQQVAGSSFMSFLKSIKH